MANDIKRRTAWFREAKYGMFLHWGVYSQLGRSEWDPLGLVYRVEFASPPRLREPTREEMAEMIRSSL